MDGDTENIRNIAAASLDVSWLWCYLQWKQISAMSKITKLAGWKMISTDKEIKLLLGVFVTLTFWILFSHFPVSHVIHNLRNTFRNPSAQPFRAECGIAPICVADTTRAVWTQRLSAAKIVSGRHIPVKCEHGPCDCFEINYTHFTFKKINFHFVFTLITSFAKFKHCISLLTSFA